MLDHIYDYDNQFIRMITVALSKTLSSYIRWINNFDTKETGTGLYRVIIPFYTSLTGDERFIFDAFVDDIVDKRVTLNSDQFQKGIVTFTGMNPKSDQFANPNQYLAQKGNINEKYRSIISKVKAVPLSLTYDIEIHLATSNEVAKCSQKILNFLFNYMFFNIDYYGMKIDANFILPDDKSIEIPREIKLDTDRKKIIKFSLSVDTYYPIFAIELDDLIVCDNDDLIDWGKLGVPKPTLNYQKSIENYNKNYNMLSNDDGASEIKQVYWDVYFHELSKYYDETAENKKEDFNIYPNVEEYIRLRDINNDIDDSDIIDDIDDSD